MISLPVVSGVFALGALIWGAPLLFAAAIFTTLTAAMWIAGGSLLYLGLVLLFVPVCAGAWLAGVAADTLGFSSWQRVSSFRGVLAVLSVALVLDPLTFSTFLQSIPDSVVQTPQLSVAALALWVGRVGLELLCTTTLVLSSLIVVLELPRMLYRDRSLAIGEGELFVTLRPLLWCWLLVISYELVTGGFLGAVEKGILTSFFRTVWS